MAGSAASNATRARSVSTGRPPSDWLGERSTITATTSRKGSRISSTTVGLASAASPAANASARHHIPPARRAAPYPSKAAQANASPATAGHGKAGVKTMSVTAVALVGTACASYSPSRSRIAGMCT